MLVLLSFIVILQFNNGIYCLNDAKSSEFNDEFPDYFKSIHSIADGRGLVEKTIYSVLNRVQLPYMITSISERMEEEGKDDNYIGNIDGLNVPPIDSSLTSSSLSPSFHSMILNVDSGFLDHIVNQVESMDSLMKAYLVGGVIRSALSYIYLEIHKQKPQNASQVISILESMERDTHLLENFQVLGIGSDFDVAIGGSDKDTLEKVRISLEDWMNFPRKLYNLDQFHEIKLINNLMIKGEVVIMQKFISNVQDQGGAHIDMYLYDIKAKKLILSSSKREDLKDDFLEKGELDYLPTLPQPSHLPDHHKQAIRALRSWLEMPWLKLSLRASKQLEFILDDIIASAKITRDSGVEMISPNAIKQLVKMTRNCRFQCAHNRLWKDNEPIGVKVREFLGLWNQNQILLYLFPLHPLPIPLHLSGNQTSTPNFIGLIDREEFYFKYTMNGILYYGLDNLDDLLIQIRNGLFYTDKRQIQRPELYWNGNGIYMSGNEEYLKTNILRSKWIFPINPNLPEGLRILDWGKFRQTPYFTSITMGQEDIHDSLVKKWKVDIIVYPDGNRELIVILNGSILSDSIIKESKDLIKSYSNALEISPELTMIKSKFPLTANRNHKMAIKDQNSKEGTNQLSREFKAYGAIYEISHLLGIRNKDNLLNPTDLIHKEEKGNREKRFSSLRFNVTNSTLSPLIQSANVKNQENHEGI